MVRQAVMPSIIGIVMSISTRSGCSAAYFSTASCPLDASPATSYPFWVSMFFSVTRINRASSVMSIVFGMGPSSVRQANVLYYRAREMKLEENFRRIARMAISLSEWGHPENAQCPASMPFATVGALRKSSTAGRASRNAMPMSRNASL